MSKINNRRLISDIIIIGTNILIILKYIILTILKKIIINHTQRPCGRTGLDPAKSPGDKDKCVYQHLHEVLDKIHLYPMEDLFYK